VDLRLLTASRTDLICDRVRAISWLRATLLEYLPALERAFDYSKKAPLILLGGYQTPESIRRKGLNRLAGWLRKRGTAGTVPRWPVKHCEPRTPSTPSCQHRPQASGHGRPAGPADQHSRCRDR
jgi:hypothetical protein